MVKNSVPEEDVLYVTDHPIRVKIMKYLSSINRNVSIADLSKSIGERKGNVNHHCRGLEHQGLAGSVKVNANGKLFFKITGKGLLVLPEVERRLKNEKGKV